MLRYIRSTAVPGSPRPALFVDRDGVLNRRREGGYVLEPRQLHLLDAVVPVLAEASRFGTPIVVVSNQGCISRDLLSEAGLLRIHASLVEHLHGRGVSLQGIYVCPHHPSAKDPADRACSCRKPAGGLLLAAAEDLSIDLCRSVLIGDQETDRQAGEAVGIDPARIHLIDGSTAAAADVAELYGHVARQLGWRAVR